MSMFPTSAGLATIANKTEFPSGVVTAYGRLSASALHTETDAQSNPVFNSSNNSPTLHENTPDFEEEGAKRSATRKSDAHVFHEKHGTNIQNTTVGLACGAFWPLRWAVFWDLENVPVPKGISGQAIVSGLQRSLARLQPGPISILRIHAAGNILALPRWQRNELQANGVTLAHVESRGRKDAADKAIIAELCLIPAEHKPPFGVVLLSGDGDFAYALARMSRMGYKTVVIASNRKRMCSSLLASVPDMVWGLREDILEWTPQLPLQLTVEASVIASLDEQKYRRAEGVNNRIKSGVRDEHLTRTEGSEDAHKSATVKKRIRWRNKHHDRSDTRTRVGTVAPGRVLNGGYKSAGNKTALASVGNCSKSGLPDIRVRGRGGFLDNGFQSKAVTARAETQSKKISGIRVELPSTNRRNGCKGTRIRAVQQGSHPNESLSLTSLSRTAERPEAAKFFPNCALYTSVLCIIMCLGIVVFRLCA